MARIKYGSIISEISGSAGSATFQKSLYGNIMRNRPRNTRTGTPAQLLSRSIMIQCQYGWNALNDATRKQWDQYIAFSGAHIKRDSSILLTGHSLFLKYNYHRLLKGESLLTVPIYISAPSWPSLSYIQLNTPNPRAVFTNSLDTLNIYPTLFLSYKRPGSQAFSKQGIRYLLPTSITGSSVFIGASYLAAFGANFALNDILHYQVQYWSRTAPILSAIQTGIKTVIA